MKFTYIECRFKCFECGKSFYDKQGLKKHIQTVHNLSNEEINIKVENAEIFKSEKENTIIFKSKDENDKLKEKEVGDVFFDSEIGNFVKVCYGCPVENCKKK